MTPRMWIAIALLTPLGVLAWLATEALAIYRRWTA